MPSTLIAEIIKSWGDPTKGDFVPTPRRLEEGRRGAVLSFLSRCLEISRYMPGDLENDCVGAAAVLAIKDVVAGARGDDAPELWMSEREKEKEVYYGLPVLTLQAYLKSQPRPPLSHPDFPTVISHIKLLYLRDLVNVDASLGYLPFLLQTGERQPVAE